MAEVSFLHFPEDDHDLFLEEFSGPTCDFDLADDFSVENGVVSSSDRKNQVNFVMDLFHQRVEESSFLGNHEIAPNDVNESTFGVIEENFDVGPHNLDLESNLGLGLGLVDREIDYDDDDCHFTGFAVCEEDFYIGRRRRTNLPVNCDEGSSRVTGFRCGWGDLDSDVEVEVDGIDNVLFGIDVNSDEEDDFGVDNVNDEHDDYNGDDDDGDLSVTLCWDSLHLEENENNDNSNDNVEVNHDFEWEEVDDDDGGGVDDRDVSSFMAEDGSVSILNISGLDDNGEIENRASNLEWEVLLDDMIMSNIDTRNLGVQDDDFYTAEYEMMFGQFAEGGNAYLAHPPASKAVVEKLPSMVITKEDVVDEKSLCAVCKDNIEVGEEGKTLPCSHIYHGDCIVPWLGIRNTCPVCRFELPTDDPDYEQRRLRSSTRVA